MLDIERAEGVYLYGTNGKAYIDMISGISVSNVGHCHPEVVKAVQEQAAKFMHLMVYGEYIYSPQIQFATRLAEVLPGNLSNVYFVNSGAEATEGAMKLAKRATGRTQIAYFNKSYHGSTQGALSIMGDEYFKNAYRPLIPDTIALEYNNPDTLERITERTACVFMEPVQAESGINPATREFMQAIRKRCDETGTLLVLDEIQTGLGRTGTMFACEQYEVIPDIILLAKGLGGGMPIGAFIAAEELMASLKHDPILGHITTFGGHPVTCAAGLASLNVLLGSTLISEVRGKEALLKELLVHPAIKAVRSKGLMMALEFDSFEQNKRIIDACIEGGVITDWFLFESNCLRIGPPLTITEEEIRKACEIILNAIETAA